MRLKGKAVVVTGGGSSIGQSTSLHCVPEGARVLVVDIVGEKVERSMCEITDAGGIAEGLVPDVSTEQGAKSIPSRIGPRCLLNRFGNPEEISPVIVLLSSDEASYITGATFVADGGYTS